MNFKLFLENNELKTLINKANEGQKLIINNLLSERGGCEQLP